MIENSATEKHTCDFCGKDFIKESSMLKHLCERKRRWQDKDKRGNSIGFQCWLDFYAKNTTNKKKRTYEDFIKSSYYIAFVKFGNYCIDANVLNVDRYADWLLKEKISVDKWIKDNNYTKFIIYYCKTEDPLDAIARSIETTIKLAESDKIPTKDVFRYGNKNKICFEITKGKISPWILYQSLSGQEFLASLDITQQKMILEYINPEQWAIKFKRQSNIIGQIKELLTAGGY